MSRISGRNYSIGIAKENARGTLHGAAEYWLPHTSFSAIERIEKVRNESGLGVLETPSRADYTKRFTEGDLEMNVHDKSIGLLLLSLFGTETFDNDAPESSVGTHVFTVANSNQHQSLSLYLASGVRDVASANAVVNSMSFEAVLDDYVKVTTSFMGKVLATYDQTAAYVAENLFRPTDVTVKFGAAVSNLTAASAVGTVRRFSFEVNKNVEDFTGLGSYDPVDFLNRNFEVTGELEILFEDTTYLGYVLNNTFRAMRLRMANGGVVVGKVTNPSLTFDFSQVDFHDPEVDRSLENITVLTVSFTAHYKLSETDMLEATLVNGVNSAY